MRKIIALLVCIGMLLSISFTLVSCSGEGTGEGEGEGNGDVGGGDKPAPAPTPDPTPDPTPEPEKVTYTATEKYLPDDVKGAIYNSFEEKSTKFAAMNISIAPYTYTDVYTVSDARVISITIPVMATKTQDDNGNYIFTMYKVRNSYSGVCATKLATYAIEISAQEHLLSENQGAVYKAITVDLSSYDIVLSENETLAFGKDTDTLVCAMLENTNMTSEPIATINNKFPQAIGVFNSTGRESTKVVTKELTLCFDLEFERSFESEAERDAYVNRDSEYARIVEALKEIYAGKKISVMGDSISTYDGFTSNPDYNLTLSVNAVNNTKPYYPTYDKTTSDYTKTYWGRLLTELDMQLCVANAISGGFVSNSSGDKGNPFQDRAAQLHRDNGTQNNRTDDTDPDVIIMYQGINDVDNGRSTGQLLAKLNDKNDNRDDWFKVGEWFDTVLNEYKGDGSYVEFDEAYALAIYNMIETYGFDVEIYCVTLVKNESEKCSMATLNNFNRVIKAIAEYFGATVIDQNGELSEFSSASFYTKTCYDGGKFIHANSAGHYALGRLIVNTMAQKNGLM